MNGLEGQSRSNTPQPVNREQGRTDARILALLAVVAFSATGVSRIPEDAAGQDAAALNTASTPEKETLLEPEAWVKEVKRILSVWVLYHAFSIYLEEAKDGTEKAKERGNLEREALIKNLVNRGYDERFIRQTILEIMKEFPADTESVKKFKNSAKTLSTGMVSRMLTDSTAQLVVLRRKLRLPADFEDKKAQLNLQGKRVALELFEAVSESVRRVRVKNKEEFNDLLWKVLNPQIEAVRTELTADGNSGYLLEELIQAFRLGVNSTLIKQVGYAIDGDTKKEVTIDKKIMEQVSKDMEEAKRKNMDRDTFHTFVSAGYHAILEDPETVLLGKRKARSLANAYWYGVWHARDQKEKSAKKKSSPSPNVEDILDSVTPFSPPLRPAKKP